MNTSEPDILELSSDSLLSVFTRGGFLRWVALAVVIHAVVIGLCSLGALLRQMGLVKTAPAVAAAPAVPGAPATAATNDAPAAPAAPAPAPGSEQALLRERAATPVVQRVTAAASSNEIPAQPDELGISLEDTNVR